MIAFQSFPMSSVTKMWRYIALVSHVLLIVWTVAWQFYFNEVQVYSTTFILLFYVLPILLPLHGIIKAKPYTHAWASFLVLFYLTHAITVLYAEPLQRPFAFIECILSLSMFTGCCLFARLRGKECGLKLGKLKDVMEKEKAHFEGK